MSSIQNIAIRTCERPAFVRRILASIAGRVSDSECCVWVFDDSSEPSVEIQNEKIVASANDRFGFQARYLGRQWQASFISRLKQKFPDDAKSIDWLLERRNPALFTGGRLINLINLALAGHRYALFDDDFMVNVARHLGDGNQRELECRHDPERRIFAMNSVRSARQAGQLLDQDPLDLHFRFLGQRVGDCVGTHSRDRRHFFTSESLSSAESLMLGMDSQILTTGNGEYGIPIAPNAFSLFYQDYERSDPPWTNPAVYRITRRGLGLWNVTLRPTLMPKIGSTPSGVDNRIMMPPTISTGKGEDTLFSRIIKFTHPKAAHLVFPWALEHSRAPLNWPFVSFSVPPQLQLAKILWKQVDDLAESLEPGASAEERMRKLSGYWLDFYSQPQKALATYLLKRFNNGASWRLWVIEQRLQEIGDRRSPAFRDLVKYRQTINSVIETNGKIPVLRDHPGLQGHSNRINWLRDEILELAKALETWPRLWQWAEAGHPLDQ